MTDVAATTRTTAAALHAEALVVDTLAGFGPSLYTPTMRSRLAALIADGVRPSALVAALEGWKYEALLTPEADGFWQEWQDSGVDVVSVTIGGFGDRFFTHANAVRDLARVTEVFDRLPDRLLKIRTADDIEQAHREGRRGVILNFQNTTHLDDDLSNLDLFHRFGVRVMTLTYNTRNSVGDGCTTRTRGGLSTFGVEVVQAMNEVGVLVDLAHACDATAMDAIAVSRRPVSVTHSFSADLSGHDRGLTDAVIQAVGEQGGYFGVCLVPFFLTAEQPVTLDHWLAHVDRAVELAGIEHVGIGTDWHREFPPELVDVLNPEMARVGFQPRHRTDWGAVMEGFASWRRWPNLTAALLHHGYSVDEVRGLIGGNFLRVFRSALDGEVARVEEP